MYGAILGDMIGSPYEFNGIPYKEDFPLLRSSSRFTDDTVMSIAVAEALIDNIDSSDDEIRDSVLKSILKWGRKYPYAGYGGMFRRWLASDDPKPYNSYGNGSAMRVSSVGWLYNDLEKVQKVAKLTAEVTHNHPEGVKGAQVIAGAVFLARNKSTKDEIGRYISDKYGYDLTRTCDEIQQSADRHNTSCQMAVPESVTAFLASSDFEDAVRKAVMLGGDCDTIACITGSIAEPFYGISSDLIKECEKRLDPDILEVLRRFDQRLER